MASQRLSPQEARTRLKQLTEQAEPQLAQKLISLAKWIKDKKDGLLMSKPYVLDLLTEVILDVQLWLILKSLSHQEKQQFYASENFSVTERYWLEVLFPRWINNQDPKFPSWKREVMNGNFKREDEQILRNLSQELTGRGGSCSWRHLLDLSMATDLLASTQCNESLCVQLTTISGTYLTDKRQGWENTLRDWQIDRGLLISYNPTQDSLMPRIVKVILNHGDRATASGYNVVANL